MNELYFFNLNCCPGCKSKDSNIIYTCNYLESPIRDYLDSFYGSQGKINFEYLKGSAYILKECGECGLIYQDQIPNDLLMKKIYNEWIDPKLSLNGLFKKKEWNFKQYSSYAQEIMILIDYFKKIKRPLNFFDFGMGWGRWCLMAKAFGCNVYGTELSISKIKYAKSIGINIINWDEIPNFKFDFINTEQIFEHISNPLETLKYISHSLNLHGLIKISVPDGGDIRKRLKKLDWSAQKGEKNSLNAISPLEHINCFKRSSVIKMACLAGLELVKIPITIQLAYTTNWKGLRKIIRNLGTPIYRNILKRGTYLFFRKTQ